MRIVLSAALAIYSVVLVSVGGLPEGSHPPLALAVYVIYIPYSFLVLAVISRWPQVNVARRVLTIAGDYVAMTWMLAFGGEPALPVFAIVIWVTVGNGLRFGPPYLLASTALALASLLVAGTANAWWGVSVFVALTFAATAILVPTYVYVLLQRLQRAYQAAHEANLTKSRFLAHASHDLRQPIHAISLFTACLRDAGLQPRELQMVENIDRSLQSVSRLFKSLLDVSTLDSGRVTPKPEVVAIADIVEDLVRQNSEWAQRTGTELHCVRSSAFVEVDRGLLTTMLQNIVTNAIKYAPGRAILIGCRRRGGTLSIGVYDQGTGIAPEHQAQVFEEFYQIRRRGDRDIEGVGLGLPIVSRLARLLGLQVVLKSIYGRGTCVELRGLKLTPKVAKADVRPSARLTSAIEGLRVLLIEDDPDVLLATASLLRNWGCDVQAETAVPEGAVRCDLLITDFDLGGDLTGTECIAKLRSFNGPELPVVVMSGHDEARVREDLDEPDIPILSKPVRPAELRSVVLAKALEGRGRGARGAFIRQG